MRPFQSAYIGRHNFPKGFGEFELRQWFTFDVRDRRSMRKAFRSRHWIGAALQLGFIAMTGTTLRSLEYVPTILLRHLGRQFVQKAPDLATLRSLYRRSQTLYVHQRWAIEFLELRKYDESVKRRLSVYLGERTQGTLSRTRLEQIAREWLYRICVEIPGNRVIADLVRAVVHAILIQDHEQLRQHRPDSSVSGCLALLLEHRPGRAMTHLEWLRRPPRRRSLKTLRELFEKYEWLERLLGHSNRLPIPKERQRVYARRMRRRRAEDVSQLPLFRQEIEAMCFATVTLATLADDMLRLLEMRIVAIWTWGYKIAAERITPQRVRRSGEVLVELRRLVTDSTLTDTAFRVEAIALLLPDPSSPAPSRAADVREVLSRNARRIRPLLELLVKLDIRGVGPGYEGLAWLKEAYKDRVDSFWVPTAPPWMRRWKALVENFDARRALRAFEAATISAVRQGLRNGSLYSPYGEEFSDPAHHLMPQTVWQARRGPYQLEKSLPQRPEQYSDRAQAALRASLARLQDAVVAGEVWIGRKDLYFRRDEAEEQPEGVDLAQATLYREIGRVQLPTLLLELDARVHFSWRLLGREPKQAEELLGVYGALLGAGTDLESRGIAGMIRGVQESAVRRYMRLFEAEPAMREANDALLHFARSHSIVNHWAQATRPHRI